MNECRIYNTPNSKPLSIRMPRLACDKKRAYVESVLDVLIESRFGPGRSSQLVINLSDRPELEDAVFFDLLDDEMVPCYELLPEGRFGYQVVEAAYRKAKQMGLIGPRPNGQPKAAECPANFGRGSP